MYLFSFTLQLRTMLPRAGIRFLGNNKSWGGKEPYHLSEENIEPGDEALNEKDRAPFRAQSFLTSVA
jgi:hypothetical protein